MSNFEKDPPEILCADRPTTGSGTTTPELLVPRDVPLGGPRGMNVRRTLPQRRRSLIGSWCFLDHYGPRDLTDSQGMNVPRHPHTGLQTVSWLFSGEIEHRDSTGTLAVVRPGELNLMTAGSGISHSEFSTPETTILHGAQLWIALPNTSRDTAPAFEHYRPDPISGQGWVARVFLGSLLGDSAPSAVHRPLVGAELRLEEGATLVVDTEPGFEYGLLLDAGSLLVDETEVPMGHLAYLPQGSTSMSLRGLDGGARLLLIGGEPLGEQIVMWWNFVGRSHQELVDFRTAWQQQIDPEASQWSSDGHDFGPFPAGQPAALPAPEMPNARLKPRS
ncbi:MAG: pirin family protein [Arthrobacter sp.]|uniref:pirin family protein n=1 Tax=unclassified Arthrobacter TaxID=235627 RepID=UPI002655D924|nr:pirin family protein [Micrococcaceae bacterium]MDN5812857.1 pirin family protein [Micrococcaceae bacterium]MDN5823897.1 pirin family protein [Micrococcaceae bacterium]MDN5880561.1 pirin family protein [Micrococcaceae bacterium]MDN5887450.1 pirin family protein [Micrococcaceae bacterium]